jgi:5-methylcytosine-specific restriction protein A
MAWNTNRAARLPGNWKTLRQQVKHRAGGQCQWVTSWLQCTRPGTECDHITPGDDHRLSNLQWLCTEHHQEKTITEAQAARRTVGRKREPMQHPGLN